MNQLRFEHPETPGLVSVIIPSRNGLRFIGEALDSVASQTYRDWEVIVIEDGSNDGTEQLVSQFAQAHQGHRVHYQRNATSCGAAYSRNVAFQLAAGQWIALLDCDDRWFPHHLQTCISTLESTGDDLAYSTVVMFADGTDHLIGLWGPTTQEIADFPQSLFGRTYVNPSASVMRRTLIGDVGPWDARHPYCEDVDFALHAAWLGKRFRYIGGVHCLYRKCHSGAMTQNLAGLIEVSTVIGMQYLSMPGLRPQRLKRMIAKNVVLAARLHATSNPAHDPSAKPGRAAPLYYRAWRLDPRRVKNLFKAAICYLRYGVTATQQLLDRPSLPEQVASDCVPNLATKAA